MDDDQPGSGSFYDLLRTADRLDSLAETAALMDDHDGSVRLRARAANARLRAMALLDE